MPKLVNLYWGIVIYKLLTQLNPEQIHKHLVHPIKEHYLEMKKTEPKAIPWKNGTVSYSIPELKAHLSRLSQNREQSFVCFLQWPSFEKTKEREGSSHQSGEWVINTSSTGSLPWLRCMFDWCLVMKNFLNRFQILDWVVLIGRRSCRVLFWLWPIERLIK